MEPNKLSFDDIVVNQKKTKKKSQTFIMILSETIKSNFVFTIALLGLILIHILLIISFYSTQSEIHQYENDSNWIQCSIDKSREEIASSQSYINELDNEINISMMDYGHIVEERTQNLQALKSLKNEYNNWLNNKLNGRISQLLESKDDIDLVERWTTKTMLFACYNSYTNGALSGKVFHSNCDMYNNTLTLIQTYDNIILGGFTTQTWDGETNKNDNDAFIFSFKSRKKYKVRPGKPAISASFENLPVFGEDIALTKDIFYTNFPTNYGDVGSPLGEFYQEGRKWIQVKMVEVIVMN